MKRKLKWIAVVLVVLLAGMAAALFLWPRDQMTTESWGKIRLGMTEKEVEGILGEPGIRYADYLAHIQNLKKPGKVFWDVEGIRLREAEGDWHPKMGEFKVWIGKRGILGIQFQGSQVRCKLFQELFSSDHPTFLDRLRDWLGW